MTIELAAALAAALAVFMAARALWGGRSPAQRRMTAWSGAIQRHPDMGEEAPETSDGQATILRDEAGSEGGSRHGMLPGFHWRARRAARLDQADLSLRVGEYAVVLLVVGALLTALGTVVSGSIVVGLGAGVVGVVMGEWLLARRAKQRQARFHQQLPSALQMMATAMEAGFSILDAVRLVSQEMGAPLGSEFTRILDETRSGGSFEESLQRLVTRIGSRDLYIVARALQSHRKVGGNLAEIFHQVGGTMREREELRGHINSLTAEQRMSAVIVAALPVVVVGLFLVTGPDFVSPLWTTKVGLFILGAAGGMEAIAFLFMRRIASINV